MIAPKPTSLKTRFERFIRTLNGFESIDELLRGHDHHGIKRADYLVYGRSIIIEQKVLESDPKDAPQKYAERLVREGKLIFWGTLSTDAIFRDMPDGQKHKRKMFDNITRQIEADVANADKQTRDTRKFFDIPNALGVLILLNQNAKMLVPELVKYGLERTVSKLSADGNYRYPHNTGFILLTENHSVEQDGMTLFPILNMQHPNKSKANEFHQFSSSFMDAWARFNGARLVDTNYENLFRAK